MKPELSIIIPCYNCAETLREAVDSCYAQGLKSFEIVMADDGSADGTRALMEKLAEERENILTVFHEKNRGGGAARNTAAARSKADLIFCLDSDDSLPENTLCRMLSCLSKKKADGIVFSGTYPFSKRPGDHGKVDFNLDPEIPASLDILFSGRPWAPGAYFLYTRAAFDAIGGYPEDHGFDTQGFGFRFVAAGFRAYPCPETFLYQRQFGNHESYFERVYSSGEFSVNYYLILRENIGVFSGKIRSAILNYDIFRRNTLEENILQMLQSEYRKDPTGFFSAGSEAKEDPENEYRKSEFRKAAGMLFSAGNAYANAEFDAVRYAFGAMSGRKMSMRDYREFGERCRIRPHAYNHMRPTLIQRVQRKIGKMMKK